MRAASRLVPSIDSQTIVLAHCLKDLPHLLFGLSQVTKIANVLCIPYSIDPKAMEVVSREYRIEVPTLSDVSDPEYLMNCVKESVRDDERPLVVVEVGGYFSAIGDRLVRELGERFLGIIEDTEAGHRRYECRASTLTFPVVSVARSVLKASEDTLIGPSTIFSVEKLLRSMDWQLEGRRALVLGFGNIGASVARKLQRRNCSVAVFDIDPVRRVRALAEGFRIPDRTAALRTSDLVIGATGTRSLAGQDFFLLPSGSVLASCSSRDVEFDVEKLATSHARAPISHTDVDEYVRGRKVLYLLRGGLPVNFIDGSIVGPVIALVQAELVASFRTLLEKRGSGGLFENDFHLRREIAGLWATHFVDCRSGGYLSAHTRLV